MFFVISNNNNDIALDSEEYQWFISKDGGKTYFFIPLLWPLAYASFISLGIVSVTHYLIHSD